jgi:hypothetical protein
LTLMLELRDTSLKSEHDVEFTLNLPVLAMIPDLEPSATKKTRVPGLLPTGSDASIGLRA